MSWTRPKTDQERGDRTLKALEDIAAGVQSIAAALDRLSVTSPDDETYLRVADIAR